MKDGGLILWNATVICEMSKTSWQMGIHERRLREPFGGPTIPFGSMIECHPISAKDQSRLHQFGKNVLPGIFLGYVLIAVRIWKGDILVGDVEELENLEASEIHARRPNAKDVITPKNGEHFIFPIGDVTVRSEELSVDTRGSSDKSQPKQKMTEKPATIFGRSKGITYCHHTEPRVQLYVPKEETFLIPLKCIVMTRTTHTNLDVFQESRIEDGLVFFRPSAVLFQLQSLRWFFCNSELFFFPTVMFLAN